MRTVTLTRGFLQHVFLGFLPERQIFSSDILLGALAPALYSICKGRCLRTRQDGTYWQRYWVRVCHLHVSYMGFLGWLCLWVEDHKFCGTHCAPE